MPLVYQFRSRSILSYYKRNESSSFRSKARQKSIDNFKDRKKREPYSGEVTAGAVKRLTRSIENLISIAKWKPLIVDDKEYQFKINFVTLTLYSFARRVPGKEGHKKCLEPLLRWLRTKGMTGYVWKAELQSKREDCHQLHYHLLTDVYIPYDELKAKWNELQRKAGYLDYYFEKFGNWQPNSTDVHATHNKKNLMGYFKKKIIRYSDKKKYKHLRGKYLIVAELAKSDQNKETIEGKVWDCSLNLKVAFYEISGYANITSRIAQALVMGEMQKKEHCQCTIYELTGSNRDAASYLPYPDKHFYNDRLEKMREFERLKPDISTFSTS